MLKWLVQRGSVVGAADPTLDLVTDDPLATLGLDEEKNNGGKKSRGKLKEIYSVSRTNPLYSDGILDDIESTATTSSPSPSPAESSEDDHHHRNVRLFKSNKAVVVPPPSTRNGKTVLVAVGSNSSGSSSGYASHATSAINSNSSSRGKGSTPPRIVLPASGSRIVRQTDVFKLLREQNDRSNAVVATSSNGNSPGHSLVQTAAGPPPPPVWPARLAQEAETSAGSDEVYVENETTSKRASAKDANREIGFNFVQRNPKYVTRIGMYGSAGANKDPPSSSNELRISVLRNALYVKSIEVGGVQVAGRPKNAKPPRKFDLAPSKLSSPSLQRHDSIVTDSLLQMTSLSRQEPEGSEGNSGTHDAEVMAPVLPCDQAKEDMDKVIRELTHAVIKSRNVATLTRAMNGKSSLEGRRTANRLRQSLRGLKRHVLQQQSRQDAMRELWQKTGMKTNGGRKLIADSSVSDEDQEDGSKNGSSGGRYRRKKRNSIRYCRPHGRRVGPSERGAAAAKSPSFSSTSSESSQYQMPYNKVYSELYDDGKGGKSNGGYEEDDEGSSSSSSGANKRVKFSEDIVVKEFRGGAMAAAGARGVQMYNKVRTSNGSVMIDVGELERRHPWEKFYGAAGSQLDGGGSGAGSGGKADYRSIFTSPYFDYRRTNSRSNGSTSAIYSEPDFKGDQAAVGPPPPLQAITTRLMETRDQHDGAAGKSVSRRWPNICYYWKTIFTLVMLAAILVTVVFLSVYFAGARMRSGTNDA